MILRNIQHNWCLFRAIRLVAIASGLLLLAASSYARTGIQKETMTTNSQTQPASCEGIGSASSEQRSKQVGIALPAPPEPFGLNVEAVQTGNRLGVSVATFGDVRDQPEVADAASALFEDVFGKDKIPCRRVNGVAGLPLGTPVELEVVFEVAA